jgi:hypothetical protein
MPNAAVVDAASGGAALAPSEATGSPRRRAPSRTGKMGITDEEDLRFVVLRT